MPTASRAVRRRVLAFIDPFGTSADDVLDFVTALGEALANAIQHAGASEPIEVSVALHGDTVVAEVADKGNGFPADPQVGRASLPADALADGGRGLAIMRRCSDACIIRSAEGRGTTVRLTHRLR